MPTDPKALYVCPDCNGDGWYSVIGSACDPRCDGSCEVGCPVPVEEQTKCERCLGTGKIHVSYNATDGCPECGYESGHRESCPGYFDGGADD